MLFFTVAFHVAMVLRSGFDANQAELLISYTSKSMSNNMQRSIDMRKLYYRGIILIYPTMRPQLLVHQDDEHTHMFLHQNFTLLKCLWDDHLNLEQRISILQDLSFWLTTFNITLTANLTMNSVDTLAWQIVESYGHENPFDPE